MFVYMQITMYSKLYECLMHYDQKKGNKKDNFSIVIAATFQG